MHSIVIGTAAFAVGLFLESLLSWLFLRRLRRDFPALWEHSGRRTIWTDSDFIRSWPTVKYLRDRHYLERPNPAEIDFCERYRLPVILSYAAGWVGAATFFVSFFFFLFGSSHS